MSLLRTLFLGLTSISLMACGGGDDDKYQGPGALTNDQKLTAGTAVSNLDKIERAMEAVEGGKDADADIEDLVALLLTCEVGNHSTGDESAGTNTVSIGGETCPINYYNTLQWKTVMIDGEAYLDLRTNSHYSTLNRDVLNIVDIKNLITSSVLPAGGLPSFSATIDFESIGTVTIKDEVSGRLLSNGNIEATYYRRMAIDGFVVEARAIMQFKVVSGPDGDELELVKLELIINGQRVTAEEMAAIFPDAFGDFNDRDDGGFSLLSTAEFQ